MKPHVTFITSHAQKVEELSWHLHYPVEHRQLDLPEIQSLDPRKVVETKAQEAYRQLKRPVLVEDFSMRFTALGQLPGPFIKWFLTGLKPEGICNLLDNYATRKAQVQTCFALCDKLGVNIFDGTMDGVIAHKPRGNTTYGTDAIFIPEGQSKTWGEMEHDEQVKYSVRRIGLEKLAAFLATIGESNP